MAVSRPFFQSTLFILRGSSNVSFTHKSVLQEAPLGAKQSTAKRGTIGWRETEKAQLVCAVKTMNMAA